MKKILLLTLLLGSSSLWANLQSDIEDLDNRIFDIEERLAGKFPATPIDAKTLRIGGTIYHDQRYAVNEDGYHDSLVSTTRMDMLINGDLTDNIEYIFVPSWFFLSPRVNMDAANRRADGERQTMTLIYRLNATYKFNSNNSIVIGRFVTPFGSYVDTYSPSADNMSYWPQMVIPMGGVTFTPVLDGLMYKGQHFFKSFSWHYKIYAAIHATDGGTQASSPFQKYLLQGTPNKHHYGFRTTFNFLNSRVQLGFSGQFGERFYGSNTYRKFAVYGTDLNLNFGKFKIRAEWLKTNEGNVPNNTFSAPTSVTFATETQIRDYMAQYLDSNKESYYIEPTYQISDKWMLALRYDYADFNSLLFHHGKAKKIYSATINYFPMEKLMLKFSVDKHDYDATADDIYNKNVAGANPFDMMPAQSGGQMDAKANPDYVEYSISATLSF